MIPHKNFCTVKLTNRMIEELLLFVTRDETVREGILQRIEGNCKEFRSGVDF